MKREQVYNAIISNDYAKMLEVFNHFKNDEKFKSVTSDQDKFFNEEKAKTGELRFNLLEKAVKNIFRILEQNNHFNQVNDLPEITVKPLRPGTPVKNPDKPVIKKNPIVDYKELPENLQKLYDQNGTLTSDMAKKHAEMTKLPKGKKYDKDRKKLVNEKAAMEEQRDLNWKKIDEWWKENKIEKK
jgi:hypothetical protein